MTERRLFEHELEERLDALLFASPSHRSVERLAAPLETLTRRQQDLVLHWIGVAAQTNAELGYALAAQAPAVLAHVDADAFTALAIATLDAYDAVGLRQALETLRDWQRFMARCAGAEGAGFDEVSQRLARFLQGLSGRALALKPGEGAWTDTETIFLPGRLAHFTGAEGNRQLYLALAARLWAQTRYGTFDVDIEAALGECPDRPVALSWLAQLEAVRLEACIARELPGLARLLERLRDPWPRELAEALPALQATGADVRLSLAWALRLATRGAVPPAPTFCGRLEPGIAVRVRGERIARDSAVLRKVLAALKAVGGRKPAGPDELTVHLGGEGGAPEIRIDGEALALPPDAQAALQSLVQDLGEMTPQALVPAGEGSWSPVPQGRVPDDAPAGDAASGCRYDEWDYRREAYRRRWCQVHECEVRPGDGAFVAETRQRHAAYIRQLRRRFEALRGEDRILGRQPEGEEIDLDALVEAVNDRRSGAEPSPRLFCRRVRNERSLAAMFMVDMSGSTKGWVNDAEREALVMLCEALEQLGDRYAIYGFSGWTRTRCDLYRIKSFADRYDEAVCARIDGIEAKDYTRMGVAIRHLTKLLAEQPARHKLLVALTDGRPDDFGDEYRGTYGIEDTRRALQEARRQGIRSYCITIDRHGQDYLKRMMGPAAYTVLADVRKLPAKVADIYRKLTI